jgi:N-acetylglutamate synthase-like GNAT family acetyltransferase
MVHEFRKGIYLISTNKRKLKANTIHDFLTNSYWSKGISQAQVKKSIHNSLCFGIYYKENQVGFARVITDHVRFGYIADVFVIEKYRGRGLSVWLMKCILNHPELKDVKAWMLATRDAHGLYSKFGFQPLKEPQKYMRKLKSKFA